MTTKEKIKKRYIEHLKLLKDNDLTIEEIESYNPELYKRIHKGVGVADDCALSGNMEGFNRAILLLEKLYFEAAAKIQLQSQPQQVGINI